MCQATHLCLLPWPVFPRRTPEWAHLLEAEAEEEGEEPNAFWKEALANADACQRVLVAAAEEVLAKHAAATEPAGPDEDQGQPAAASAHARCPPRQPLETQQRPVRSPPHRSAAGRTAARRRRLQRRLLWHAMTACPQGLAALRVPPALPGSSSSRI